MENETKYNQLTDRLINMYPEIHRHLMPLVEQAADSVTDIESFDSNMLDALARKVTESSQIITPFSPIRPGTANDIARILILNELLDGIDDTFLPFFFLPARHRRPNRRFRR